MRYNIHPYRKCIYVRIVHTFYISRTHMCRAHRRIVHTTYEWIIQSICEIHRHSPSMCTQKFLHAADTYIRPTRHNFSNCKHEHLTGFTICTFGERQKDYESKRAMEWQNVYVCDSHYTTLYSLLNMLLVGNLFMLIGVFIIFFCDFSFSFVYLPVINRITKTDNMRKKAQRAVNWWIRLYVHVKRYTFDQVLERKKAVKQTGK